jgi:hypothetical protein
MPSIRISAAVLSLSLALTSAVFAKETAPVLEQDVDYGEMYVLQKRESAEKLWQLGALYSYGFSNPYVAIEGGQLDLSRKLNDFLNVGVSPAFYATAPKKVAGDLTSKLSAQGISTDVYQPEYSNHFFLGVTPLSGMLNWFSARAVDFDLRVTLGAGFAKYKRDSNVLPSLRIGVSPEVMVSKTIGVTAGVQTSFERFPGADWQNRIDAVAGAMGRF